MTKTLCPRFVLALLACLGSAASSGAAPAQATGLLPYDRNNPVMYDNDWTNDYIDWYLMALASAGDISYRGITTTSSIPPYNRHMPEADLDAQIRMRGDIVRAGRNSGFRNVPDPLAGPRGNLVKPASGLIEDTRALDSPGSRAIVAQARAATATRPLVVCLGGPLTAVADAYLLDPSIADKMVVAWTGGSSGHMMDYNGWADGWAAYIALQRLRLVQFPVSSGFFPRLSKAWIEANLPASEAKTYMLSLGLDVVNGDDGDADGMPAVSVGRTDYVQSIRRVAFAGWTTADGHEAPTLREDANARAIQVTAASGQIASEEYQRAFLNPAAWGTTAPQPSPPPPGPAGLGAHWTFDEGSGGLAADASGNGNDGMLRNGAGWIPGMSGSAGLLDGGDDFVEISDSPSLSIAGPLTLALWYRYDGKADDWGRIAVKDWGSAAAPWVAYGLTLDDGAEGAQKVSFGAGLSSTQTAGVTAPAPLVVGEWVHLAGVFDPAGGSIAIYVDGIRVSESPTALASAADSPGPFLIGRASWGGHRIKGAVDDVRVYAEALDAAEIAALAAASAASPPPAGAGASPSARDGKNGDEGINDAVCGATGAEVVLILALVACFRRRLAWKI